MNNLNQIEIQNIRHICGHSSGFCKKIDYYKTIITDQNATQKLNELCTKLETVKTELKNLL